MNVLPVPSDCVEAERGQHAEQQAQRNYGGAQTYKPELIDGPGAKATDWN
jgi:hypothetical protein